MWPMVECRLWAAIGGVMPAVGVARAVCVREGRSVGAAALGRAKAAAHGPGTRKTGIAHLRAGDRIRDPQVT
jgi:hypothetical protein